ncbi:MAG: Fe-S cluster assembly protein SufB [Nanoarchaeota archaeon]
METLNREIFDHKNKENLVLKTLPGLSDDVIKIISEDKKEPEWMKQRRLEALKIFKKLKMPDWGPSLKNLDLNKIIFYTKPNLKQNAKSWDEVPEDVKKTFERLGIPQAEREYLAGVGSQYDSINAYHKLKEEWEKKGVIFEDFDEAVKKYPELVQKYYMNKCVSPNLHKFAALHAAVTSSGTFIYIPKGVKVSMPLQAYFRMNAERGGQFEHTLIVVDDGAEVSYIEGCSSPSYTSESLHAGCVEIFVGKNARARYISVENWSKKTYNLNTKRAIVDENGIVEWINCNTGSCVTMLYPTSVLIGKNAKSEYIGIAFAGKDQHQDTGHKSYLLAEDTSSNVISKSISKDGGITAYRGLIKIGKNAKNAKSSVQCDALLADEISKSDTIPYMNVQGENADTSHEATVGKISKEKIFYLMSKGLSKEEASKMIVSGFIEPVTKVLPIEYAVEFNKLIEMEMEGAVG